MHGERSRAVRLLKSTRVPIFVAPLRDLLAKALDAGWGWLAIGISLELRPTAAAWPFLSIRSPTFVVQAGRVNELLLLGFGDGDAQLSDDDIDGTHRIVVTGNGDICGVRIAIGIDQADCGDAELTSFFKGSDFSADVDDDERAGELFHVTDTFKVPLDLALLALELALHLLGIAGEVVARFDGVELVEALETSTDGAEVGERAAQPTLGDVMLLYGRNAGFDDVLSLTLGTNKADFLAIHHQLGDKLFGNKQTLNGFLNIDNMNAVTLAIDVWLHFGVPTAGTLAKVNTGFDEVLNELIRHLNYLSCSDTGANVDPTT